MAESTAEFLRMARARAARAAGDAWAALRHKTGRQVRFWLIALAIGIIAGGATVAFRHAIAALQTLIYGTSDVMLASAARDLPWALVLTVPIVGGLIVGLVLNVATNAGRAHSVADVISGAALDAGRVDLRKGAASALASLVTLCTGGSTGREGPVVHIGAMIATWVSVRMKANEITARDLLGCAVAATVSASFNAPIAGTIFALEVILRHFAVHAFAPIVVASVAGTVVSRLSFGNITEFSLPTEPTLAFYVELPAFAILGLLCGLVGALMTKGIFWAEDTADHVAEVTRMPVWARPAVAGAVLGATAIYFPHIIGVGYETTSAALTGKLVFWGAVGFAVVKVFAVAITIAGRMGGGVFSPSLMVGALTGLAFGQVATALLPSVSGGETIYALAGMGAVAAAVLGAPISTTLIVFELTGDWQTGIAVMVTVSLASALASRIVDRSYFLSQLERRNIHLAAGPQAYLLSQIRVASILRPLGSKGAAKEDGLWEMVEEGIYVDGNATLEVAMPLIEDAGRRHIPVVTLGGEDEPPQLWGSLHQVDALKAYNAALAETAREEHS